MKEDLFFQNQEHEYQEEEDELDEKEMEFLGKIKCTKEDIHDEYNRIIKGMMESNRGVEYWMEPMNNYQSPFHGYCKIRVDVEKIDERWKYSTYYVEKEAKTKKYVNSRRDIWKGRVKEPPLIEVGRYGSIEIVNGRHRFANLRDMGVKKMICMCKKVEMDALKEMLGYLEY
jgi:hypothetical protein